ncbi:MAG: hypothetical protein ACYDD7_20700 [Acidimicrobiales bacterium]
MRRAAVAVALVLAACSHGATVAPNKLDGTPHVASDQGVVTTADRHRVVLDGVRRYSVSPNLVVFTPGSLQLAALASTFRRYALVGAHRGQVDWIEPLTVVARLPGGPPTAFFFGTLVRLAGTTATFSDGTVLRTAEGVAFGGSLPATVRADIDPKSGRVRALTG